MNMAKLFSSFNYTCWKASRM